MRLVICINYWDDPLGLMRLLQSLPLGIIYRIYIIDGSYEGRTDESRFKQDMTEAIIHSIPNIHYVKMFGSKQIDKRNKYWELAEKDEADWAIVIDSDEYVECNPDMFERYLLKLKEDFPKPQCFPLRGNNLGHFQAVPRLFCKPFNFRHIQQKGKISHGSLYNPEGKEIIQDMYVYYEYMRKNKGFDLESSTIPFFKLIHDKELRTKERVDADYVYYNDTPER